MQPYIFPYMGYFQLIASSDTFVYYDDVSFIKQGWINRNRILVNGEEHLFSIPLENISSSEEIRDTHVSGNEYGRWSRKFVKTLRFAYAGASCHDKVYPMLKRFFEKEYANIAVMAQASVELVLDHAGVEANTVRSSEAYDNQHLAGQDRVLDICKQEGADRYINPPGGAELYDPSVFAQEGLQLRFLEPDLPAYPQANADEHVPGLSIIDVMMHCDAARIGDVMKRGALVEKQAV